MKKLDARSRVTRRPASSAKAKDSNADLRQQLEDLSEKFDLVLPEVTAGWLHSSICSGKRSS